MAMEDGRKNIIRHANLVTRKDLQMYMTAGAWILANRDNSEEEIADALLSYSNELAALTDALQKVEVVIKKIEKSA